MKEALFGTVPAFIEVEIPDGTPEQERESLAFEKWNENPRDYMPIPDFMRKDFEPSDY